VRSGVPERATSPERSKRRVFTAEYKLRIVREADEALASGGEASVGALLRPGGQRRCRVRRARRWGGSAGRGGAW
jgi:transposase-like protein